MKRTALAVLGIALVLISLAACSPSNNGLIIPPPVVNPDKDPGNEPGKDPEPNPPTVETNPATIAEKLNLPDLIKKFLSTKDAAYEVTYEKYDSAIQKIAKAPVEEADFGIKATVKFIDDYKVNDVVTINKEGSIVYTIPGNQSVDSGFTAEGTCTVEAVNLKVNGEEIEFTATANITLSATISTDGVTVTSVSVTAVTKIENATIGGTSVTITPDESGTDPGETDPPEVDPPETDDDEEESEGTGGEEAGPNTGTTEEPEPVA